MKEDVEHLPSSFDLIVIHLLLSSPPLFPINLAFFFSTNIRCVKFDTRLEFITHQINLNPVDLTASGKHVIIVQSSSGNMWKANTEHSLHCGLQHKHKSMTFLS